MERLESAPRFRLSDLAKQEWAEDVYRYFGQQPYWTEGGGAVTEPMKKTIEEFEYFEY